MSSSTKIVVLKLKELVIACVLAVLAVILLVLFIIHITSGTRKMPDEATLGTFTPGVYTTSVILSGNTMELAVTVDSDTVKSIRLVNTSETVETMYPLISSSLEALEKQVREKGSTDGITYSADAKYTSIVLINAIDTALDKAKK